MYRVAQIFITLNKLHPVSTQCLISRVSTSFVMSVPLIFIGSLPGLMTD